jgi:hypothetical protein
MPARAVLAMAKAAGISLSKTHLYALRGSSKGATKARPAEDASKATEPALSTAAKPSTASSSPVAWEP